MDILMKKANENAIEGIKNKEGGPFGAVIVDKEGNIIANGNNKVIKNNDPTAHAEIIAIREACKKLNTYDLKDYILYTSCAYQQRYGQTLKLYIMVVQEKMLKK